MRGFAAAQIAIAESSFATPHAQGNDGGAPWRRAEIAIKLRRSHGGERNSKASNIVHRALQLFALSHLVPDTSRKGTLVLESLAAWEYPVPVNHHS